jgi:regulator of protease activity HflC (stomatin/prohibitin superfamily)
MAKFHEFLDPKPVVKPRSRRRFFLRHLPSLSVLAMTLLFAATLLFPYVVITVPSGSVGVLWKRFNGYDLYCWCFVGRGTILDPRELRDEGLHIIWPWDRLYLYSLRLQSVTQSYNAITKDGVSVTAQINARFQLLHNYVGVLHKFIGPEYLVSVLSPEIGSRAREVISQFTAEQVYTSREAIQNKIRSESQVSLSTHLNSLVQPEAMEQPDPKHYNDFLQNSIQILDTLVLSIELPTPIVAAINRQTQQYYEIQEFKYRVEREAQESARKQIEANGIAEFQRIVSKGISDSYLRWRGIEATLALAQSSNAKIVVIGSGKDGLPIILGNVDTPPGTAPAAPQKEPEPLPVSPPALQVPENPSAAAPPSAPAPQPGAPAQPAQPTQPAQPAPPGPGAANGPSRTQGKAASEPPLVMKFIPEWLHATISGRASGPSPDNKDAVPKSPP